MSEQSVLHHILQNTFTIDAVHRRVGILRHCLETALYQDTRDSAYTRYEACLSSTQNATEVDIDAVRAWGEEVFRQFTANTLRTKMRTLHQEIEALPVLPLYIPVPFPEAEIAQLGVWCRKHCHEQLLFDIHIEPRVAGGCAFVWNDVYHDFSFRSRAKAYPGIITDLLSHYAEK